MTDLAQWAQGTTAREIAASLEAAVRQNRLAPGAPLPSVRQLAAGLGVSPPTVAAALADLRRRGVIVTHARRRSIVSPRPPVSTSQAEPSPPPHTYDLARGNPDARLLPDVAPFLSRLSPATRLYGDEPVDPRLVTLARAEFAEAGVEANHICLASGALDGVERALGAHLSPGDRVIVEDPGYFAVFDLLRAMSLEPVPVPIDARGFQPDALATALRAGAEAMVLTPRAQNPTGAALDAKRAEALRYVLRVAPDLLVLEDDHQGPIAGVAGHTLTSGRARWAVVRSVAKSLGPDLRLAFIAGDAETIARIEGRLALGPGWVSHLLQGLVVEMLGDESVRALLKNAQWTYAYRRGAVVDALDIRGVSAMGKSGFNVWVEVPDEAGVVSRLLQAGWAVAPGARYRLNSPPAIRVTTACLPGALASFFAEACVDAMHPPRRSRAA
ncbi:MAG TPA: aminotransferase class I/II-fold pyridoxal phosphate-dependent enzyme [Chloroflexota bacterium]